MVRGRECPRRAIVYSPGMQTVVLRPGRALQVADRVGGLMRAGKLDAEFIGDPEIAHKTSTAEPF